MDALVKLGLFGTAAYFIMSKLTDLDKKIGVKIDSVSFNKALTQQAGFLKLFINLNLSINNQSDLQGDIKGGNIYVYVKDKLLATVSNFNKVGIPARNSVRVSLPVGINTLSIVPTVTDIIKIISAGKGSITINIKGDILTSFGTVNINEVKTVSL